MSPSPSCSQSPKLARWPSGCCRFACDGVDHHYGVVDFIHTGANPILHGLCAFSGNLPSLFYGLRIIDSVGAANIPTTYRVGFADINNQKFDLLIVLPVELLQADRLLDEWRSDETAKN